MRPGGPSRPVAACRKWVRGRGGPAWAAAVRSERCPRRSVAGPTPGTCTAAGKDPRGQEAAALGPASLPPMAGTRAPYRGWAAGGPGGGLQAGFADFRPSWPRFSRGRSTGAARSRGPRPRWGPGIVRPALRPGWEEGAGEPPPSAAGTGPAAGLPRGGKHLPPPTSTPRPPPEAAGAAAGPSSRGRRRAKPGTSRPRVLPCVGRPGPLDRGQIRRAER